MVCMSQALVDCHTMSLSQQMVQANQDRIKLNATKSDTRPKRERAEASLHNIVHSATMWCSGVARMNEKTKCKRTNSLAHARKRSERNVEILTLNRQAGRVGCVEDIEGLLDGCHRQRNKNCVKAWCLNLAALAC